MIQKGYRENVADYSDNFFSIRLEEDIIKRVSKFVIDVIKIKKNENHHFIDNSQEEKRWKNGFLGEFAVEKFLGKKFVDLTVGSSKKYFVPDLSSLGIDWGIKTVEKGKFPIIFKKSFKDEIIVIKKSDSEFFICGLATRGILDKYQSDELILSPGLRSKGTKTGFYGFKYLIPPLKLREMALQKLKI
tara:strand:- start:47 stop:610 length:564 start_codon:yes stop_codon:yes gene_type:complete